MYKGSTFFSEINKFFKIGFNFKAYFEIVSNIG